jgi:nitrogen fixation NifU-like protein
MAKQDRVNATNGAPDADGLAYPAAVLDHFQNPRNAGTLPDADLIGEAGNPACGDRMRLYLKLEGNRVSAARFQTFGCSVAIAASSMLTELVIGRDLEALARLRNSEIVAALGGLPEHKAACSILAEAALHDALSRRG